MADEKKKATEAHMRATAKYEKENYDKVLIRFPKGTKDSVTTERRTSRATELDKRTSGNIELLMVLKKG